MLSIVARFLVKLRLKSGEVLPPADQVHILQEHFDIT
jgi:hypothetical protein